MRISDWSSDVCSSDLLIPLHRWEFRETMPRAGLRPGQHLACITLHERREQRRIIERPGADVDETHVGLDPREQPTLAPRSDDRSEGKEWVMKSRSRWSRYH